MSNIVERIRYIIDNKSLSVRAFEMSIGASNGLIGRAISKNTDINAVWLSKIVEAYPEINSEWLLSGRGGIYNDIVKEDDYIDIVLQSKMVENKYNIDRSFLSKIDRSVELQRVPLYELEATAGLAGLFLNEEDQRPVSYLSIPDLPRCDGAIYVKGDSMYPLLKSGDIVVYKQLNEVGNIVWGEMYLVSFSLDGDEYTAVKFINKIEDNKEYIKLVSQNQHHASKDIPMSSIRALAIIKASVRFNTMG